MVHPRVQAQSLVQAVTQGQATPERPMAEALIITGEPPLPTPMARTAQVTVGPVHQDLPLVVMLLVSSVRKEAMRERATQGP